MTISAWLCSKFPLRLLQCQPLLAETMAKFDMIDTVQMGIRKVFNIQRDRYFPLPDYDFSTSQKVAVTVYGKVLDENYTRLLFGRNDLTLDTVFLLDRVQKKLPLENEQYKSLKKLGVVEGKIPKVYVSAKIADVVDERAQYIKNKGQNDQFYKQMIIEYLKKWGNGTKSDFIELLNNKLPDILDKKQKESKIKYFLTSMRQNGIIERMEGNQRTGAWTLVKND